jgi:hypothetical protein
MFEANGKGSRHANSLIYLYIQIALSAAETSSTPGSHVVSKYLEIAGLRSYLNAFSFRVSE